MRKVVSHGQSVAILGGAVSGLAAATATNGIERIDEIRVFERQEYDEKRVNCGEAINDSTLIPLETTEENGFLNNVDGFQLRVYTGTDRDPDETPLGVSTLRCEAGYICDRDTVEARWANKLADRGVSFETGTSITATEYQELVNTYDYIIDATGQPSLTHKVRDAVTDYTGDMVALNRQSKGISTNT